MTGKRLNEALMTTELGGSAFFSPAPSSTNRVQTDPKTPPTSPKTPSDSAPEYQDDESSTLPVRPAIEAPRRTGGDTPSAPVSQTTERPTGQSTEHSGEPPCGQVVGRPKAFYITTRLDERLDSAVRYFQEVHHIAKADRSTVMNVLLDKQENFTSEQFDQLVDRVINQLTSRLIG